MLRAHLSRVIRGVPGHQYCLSGTRWVVTCLDKACLRSLLGAAGARAFAHTCTNGVDCSLQDDHMGLGGHADEPNFAIWSKFR